MELKKKCTVNRHLSQPPARIATKYNNARDSPLFTQLELRSVVHWLFRFVCIYTCARRTPDKSARWKNLQRRESLVAAEKLSLLRPTALLSDAARELDSLTRTRSLHLRSRDKNFAREFSVCDNIATTRRHEFSIAAAKLGDE